MRPAGRLAARILDALVPHVVPGVTTADIDDIVHRLMIEGGAVPATLGYRGFPSAAAPRSTMSCATASRAKSSLKDGDIVNIDVTPIVDGWHGDTSRMFLVGDVR